MVSTLPNFPLQSAYRTEALHQKNGVHLLRDYTFKNFCMKKLTSPGNLEGKIDICMKHFTFILLSFHDVV